MHLFLHANFYVPQIFVLILKNDLTVVVILCSILYYIIYIFIIYIRMYSCFSIRSVHFTNMLLTIVYISYFLH